MGMFRARPSWLVLGQVSTLVAKPQPLFLFAVDDAELRRGIKSVPQEGARLPSHIPKGLVQDNEGEVLRPARLDLNHGIRPLNLTVADGLGSKEGRRFVGQVIHQLVARGRACAGGCGLANTGSGLASTGAAGCGLANICSGLASWRALRERAPTACAKHA